MHCLPCVSLLATAFGLVVVNARSLPLHTDEIFLQGTWELVSAKDDGVDLGTDGNRIVVAGKRWKARDETYSYSMFPNRRPKQIDWTCGGKNYAGIYELNADTLRLCFGLPGEPRPLEFDTIPGDGRRLHVRRRVAPSDEEE